MAISDHHPMGQVLHEIAWERRKQDEKWGEQNHPDFPDEIDFFFYFDLPAVQSVKDDCARNHLHGTDDWATILLEEFVEAMDEQDDPAKLRTELIQVAAVCVAWVEAIDRRNEEA